MKLKGYSKISALVLTFMAIYVYSCIEPAFKLILMASYENMDSFVASILSFVPLGIFLAILWMGALLLGQPQGG